MLALTFLFVPGLVAAATLGARDTRQRAAYFLDNDPAGSSIVALKISVDDGTLSQPVRISTGGKGLLGLFGGAPGTAPAPGAADTLFAQDAVVVAQDYLFTVNAGSNSVSMFTIDGANPSKPTLVSTAPSGGEFPMSIAYSSTLKTACVLNGGAVAGVACFSVDHTKGLTPLGALRPISLNQTSPPVGPPGTAADILFNPTSSALIAIIKGAPPTPGSIYTFPVLLSGLVSSTPVLSKPADILVDFGASFLGQDNKAVISDAATGASLVTLNDDFSVTVDKKIVVAGQAAICWSAYSARFNTVFLMDAGKPDITVVDPTTGDIKGAIALDAANQGSFDTAIDRGYLYALRGGSAVSVVKLDGLKGDAGAPVLVQSADLSGVGKRQGWTGLAVYPSSSKH